MSHTPKHFRVVKLHRRKGPDHWGVQRLAGYTDGRPSYQLLTERFWKRADAVGFAALSEHVAGVRGDEDQSQSRVVRGSASAEDRIYRVYEREISQ